MTATVNVLMVDDEPDFLSYTAKRLRTRGLNVETVDLPEAAIARLEKGGIDVVVLDVKMPGMDGHELFEHIHAKFPDLETIILTGHGDFHKAFELTKKGVFDYIAKPCDIDTLNDAIRNARQFALVKE